MAAVTLTAEERDAVFAQLAAGLSLTFLQGLVSFGKGEDQRQLLDGYRGVIDEALLELRGTKFVRFWVDAFSSMTTFGKTTARATRCRCRPDPFNG
jgi:hypothetical protein